MCGSGAVVCSLSLLIRWAQRARCQAETPLIVLFRFLRPALTIHFKELYRCEQLYSCAVDIVPYSKDIVLAAALVIAYVYLTVGLFVRYHRLSLVVVGGVTTVGILVGSVGVFWFPDAIARLAENC